MKIKTDITTLSKLYPIFEDAGIEGVLTGDLEKIRDLKYSELCGKLLKTGRLADICELITDSTENNGASWAEASMEEAMGVLVPFLVDITAGPIGLKANPETASQETSS